MRKFLILLTLIVSMFIGAVPMTSAQTVVSDSCTDFMSTTETTFPLNTSGNFFEGETLIFTVSGAGQFTVNVNDVLLLVDATSGASISYMATENEFVAFLVSVTGDDLTSELSLTCLPSESESAFDGTLCHYPPGNPDAAHTIRVGSENAVETHISKHGDTLGACPQGVQTRADISSVNITVFVIYSTNTIQIYGACGDECQEVLNTPIILLIDLQLVVITTELGGSEFVEIDNPEDYGFMLGETTQEGLYAVIYYLHPDPNDPSVGVFQINVYENGSLIDDSILVFIDVEGNIVLWTTQNYWETLNDDAEDDA